MIKLSMEIPIPHLEELSPLCDLDFALAHVVLEDGEYADFYKQQFLQGRQVILDNGFHELGYPLTPRELAEAAKRIGYPVVVAPDRLGEPKWNLEQFDLMMKALPSEYPLGIVLAGHTPEERASYFGKVRRFISMLLLPYREPRLDWYAELPWDQISHLPIHLLGVSTPEELTLWKTRRGSFSVDTAKPIKWGSLFKRLNELKSWRGGGLVQLDKQLSTAQLVDVTWNTAYLRRLLT